MGFPIAPAHHHAALFNPSAKAKQCATKRDAEKITAHMAILALTQTHRFTSMVCRKKLYATHAPAVQDSPKLAFMQPGTSGINCRPLVHIFYSNIIPFIPNIIPFLFHFSFILRSIITSKRKNLLRLPMLPCTPGRVR